MTKDSVPTISVLITAYNRQEYLAQAIESVLASNFLNFEVIVVDDASTDLTDKVGEHYERVDSRVRFFRNAVTLGDYGNRNRAAELARGTFIKYVDSDDSIYPHGLGVMLACMELAPMAALGLSAHPHSAAPHPRVLTPRQSYLEHFFERDLLARSPGSAIIRREVFHRVGGFSGTRQVGDHELWLRIAKSHDIVTMPMDLVWHRTHPHQELQYDDVAARLQMHDGVRAAALRADECPLEPAEREAAMMQLVRDQARNYWRLVTRRNDRRSAGNYRRKSHLRVSSIVRFALQRITSRQHK